MKKILPLVAAAVLSTSQMHAQCPTITSCPAAALEVCDLSNNNNKFWNAPYWWDNIVGSHDLAEGATELSVTAKDACFSGGLSFNYQLFLDLDNDGAMETVVDSKTPAPAGGVYFNNAANPNFSGGVFSVFDQRAVAPLLKYKFGIQVSGVGNTKTARVRWRTSGTPISYVAPQLPYGNHKIKWIVEDASGNQQACEYGFTVKDCQKPSLQCLSLPGVNIMPTGMLTLWAGDFIQTVQDNVTPSNQLTFGVRKAGTGTGFPVDGNGNPISTVTFTCNELGTQSVEVWAKDLAGNTDYCETTVMMQDNMENCADLDALFHICVEGLNVTYGISDAYLIIQGSAPGNPTYIDAFSYFSGCTGVDSLPFTSDTITIAPNKDDNPLNGVSTYDMVLIKKHIDGTEPFNSPWKFIAADADRNNIIDTFDIAEFYKLILGIYNELPNNTSWRFVRSDYVFPADPLSVSIPESVTLQEVFATPDSTVTFKAVKIGDLNGSAIANFGEETPEDREIAAPIDLKITAVFPPQPNPTSGAGVIPFVLSEASTIRFDLFNLSGRNVYSLENQLDAGEGSLAIPADAMPVVGIYIWRVMINGKVYTGKIARF